MRQSQYFRAGVGVAVLDDGRRVLTLERRDSPGAWQLPQGGIEDGEQPEQAARRELGEETGLSWEQVELVAEHPRWLAYELPRGSWSAKTGRGQVQRWFVVRLADPTAPITIDRPDPDSGQPEFRAHRWASLEQLVDEATPFRRPLYEQVASFVRSLDDEADTLPRRPPG